MNSVDIVTIAALIPATVGAAAFVVRATYCALQKTPTTLAEKETALYERLVQRFRNERHEDPQRAARDHISQHRQMEEFRRFACQEYATSGKPLEDIKEDWWKARGRAIQEVASIGGLRADGMFYARVLKGAIGMETEDEIFIYEPAKRKWLTEKAKRDAEIDAELQRPLQYDPVSAHTIESLYAAGGAA